MQTEKTEEAIKKQKAEEKKASAEPGKTEDLSGDKENRDSSSSSGEAGGGGDDRSRKQGRRGRSPRSRRTQNREKEDDGSLEKVVSIKRVSKVVKGGKNFSFSAMVVAGDGQGNVGVGLGKSNEIVEAIKKGSATAKKSFRSVKLKGDTIPHEVIGRYKASRVMLKPAGPGTGVIAGSTVRAMCDAVGIKDILTKTLGSRNAVNVVKATLDGFGQLRLKRISEISETVKK
ncbi:MAG: 30S ribosomal protein S5 [Candidatus Omnitrophica bacterium]|nr:30S ribosomal protein S5 [Candidatus Omnitrophota bacterium]